MEKMGKFTVEKKKYRVDMFHGRHHYTNFFETMDEAIKFGKYKADTYGYIVFLLEQISDSDMYDLIEQI